MTREDFDRELNNDTVLGLTQARANLKAIVALAKSYQRPDIVALVEGLVQAHDVAILEAEKLGAGVITEESLS